MTIRKNVSSTYGNISFGFSYTMKTAKNLRIILADIRKQILKIFGEKSEIKNEWKKSEKFQQNTKIKT